MQKLIEQLRNELGDNAVLTGEDIGEKYQVDTSRENQTIPVAVLRPATAQQLSTILRYCYDNDQRVVVQGGMTGLSGGATPLSGEMAIALERMTGIEEIDHDSMTMTVLAGTPLQIIQEEARTAGYYLPLDMGARGSCTIGGNVATNAGGNQVIRYGMTRALVLGLEVVLADGTILSSLNKMLKNNAGYDLKHLFIGTEGTLGVVTRVVLRLFPLPGSTCTALCAFKQLQDVIAFLKRANVELAGSVSSFEVMWSNYFDFVVDNVDKIRSPFDTKYAFYVLIEAGGGDQKEDNIRFENMLGGALEAGLLKDAVIAKSRKEADLFWNIRDGIAEIMPVIKTYVSFDISIPVSTMQEFTHRVQCDLHAGFNNIIVLIFGHLGDGNLHVVTSAESDKDKEQIYETVFAITRDYHGSISAEHGIGVLRKPYLAYSRTREEIDMMKTLKHALDPKGILNASRVIDG